MEFYLNDEREIKTDKASTPVEYIVFQFPDVGFVSFKRRDLDVWEHREPGKRVEALQAHSVFDKVVDILEDGYEPEQVHYLLEGTVTEGRPMELLREQSEDIDIIGETVQELREGYRSHAKDLQKNDKEIEGIKARLAQLEDEIKQLKPGDPTDRIVKANNSEGLSIWGTIVDVIEFEAPGDVLGEEHIVRVGAKFDPRQILYLLTVQARNVSGRIVKNYNWDATPENLFRILRERADHRFFEVVSYKLTGEDMPRVYPDHKEFETLRADLLQVQ